MGWMRVEIPDSSRSEPELLQNRFVAVFTSAKGPKDAAMFEDKERLPNNGRNYYFSPRAVEIFAPMLRLYKAEDCPRPPRESLIPLVVIGAEILDLLYPSG